MKELSAQINEDYIPVPYSEEDLQVMKNFKINQIVRIKVSGTKKERSIPQLGLLFACMKVLADQNVDVEWNTVPKIQFQIKVRLKFVDMEKSVFINNVMHFHYRSFSFAELEHMEACDIFTGAFDLMADKLQVTKEKLIEIAEERMQNNYLKRRKK